MHFFLSSVLLVLLMALAPAARAQNGVATVVVYVTVPASTPSTAATIHQQALSTASSTSLLPSTFATQISSSTPLAQSIVQATFTVSSAASTPTSPAGVYNAPGAGAGGAVDTEAGASGSDSGSFNISKGGLAAIIIVVILVALFGIASIVLFIIAKRRQWTMRETISRASRRLTGRFGEPKTPRSAAAVNRQSRRAGIRMNSPPRPGIKAVYPPGHPKAFAVNTNDPEKGLGPLDGRAPKNTRPREKSWVQRLWGDGWK